MDGTSDPPSSTPDPKEVAEIMESGPPKRTPNPKKVAAGRASAAARKAREAQVLDELRRAKAAIPPPQNVDREVPLAKPHAEPKAPLDMDMSYAALVLVVGGLVVVGWLYSRKAKAVRAPAPPPPVILKADDPFHMD